MNASNSATGLTLRFLDGPPQEEAIYFARRCFAQAGPDQQVTLIVHWNRDQVSVREVRAVLPNGLEIVEREPNLMLAIRNACARTTSALAMLRSRHHAIAAALLA